MRARERHIHQSLLDDVTGQLQALGWLAPGGVKSVPVTVVDQDVPPGTRIAPNTVGVTLGSDGPTREGELGGGLKVVEYAAFVDVYGESEALALHIAGDLRAFLDERFVPFRDYTGSQTGVLLDDTLEVVDLQRVRPDVTVRTEYRRFWQILKMTLRCEYRPDG